MNLNAVMDALGTALRTIDGLRVYDYPPDAIAEPAAVVSYPTTVRYDVTYAGGADMAEFPVHVLVGKASDRASRALLNPYVDRDGPNSVKAALEADMTLGGAAKGLIVQSAEFSVMTVGAVDYVAATVTIEVYAT